MLSLLEIQSVMLSVMTGFVNYYPLTFPLVSSPPSPFPVGISILYTRIQCVREGGVTGWEKASDR
jgi:hypothetical protein